MATTVKTITRTEVSFWWHGFFVREGFYYGELLTDNNGELRYTHFVSNGNVHDRKMLVYFHIGTPQQTQKWVFVGDKKSPYGVLGKAYWQKRSAYEALDTAMSLRGVYCVTGGGHTLFYTDKETALSVWETERAQNEEVQLQRWLDGTIEVIEGL